jgi:hypothetical protein
VTATDDDDFESACTVHGRCAILGDPRGVATVIGGALHW